ncbi:12313_t:CDS:2 [Rhizophagus irregularis]|nr:12313_t:CDS:2 [Rhizophagus irregularis]
MEISKKLRLSCYPSDHSVFVVGDLESIINIAKDFYSRVQEKTFNIHDKELGNVEVYFLPSIIKNCKRKYNDDEDNQVHYNFNFNKQENQLKADIIEKSQQINNLRENIAEKDRKINNFDGGNKKFKRRNYSKKTANKGFRKKLFNSRSISREFLPYYEKEKENFMKLVSKAKEHVGKELEKFLNLLLAQNEKVEKNQDDVSFNKGQLSAYRIILQEKIPYNELEILLNKHKNILKLESQLHLLWDSFM